RLTEGEQSFDIVSEQMHLKVGVEGARAVRLEDHCLQLSENGQVGNFGVCKPIKDQQLQSRQTVDGCDQLTSQLAVHQIYFAHHQTGQLALPIGQLQKGDQSVNVHTAEGHELQVSDSRENGDDLLDGGSVDQSLLVQSQDIPLAEMSGHRVVEECLSRDVH
ncbi:hypothetical protein TYRP_007738, partial [Tyrophagus putrescentiae]